MVSLDGYFEGPGHDLRWHNVDGEFVDFAVKQLDGTGAILFGRTTYEMMAGFWPSEQAEKADPETARRMNSLPKYVASRTLKRVDWSNSRLLGKEPGADVAGLKAQDGKDIAVLGSNNLCVSLMEKGLVDEFRIMVNPVALGAGTPLFKGINGKVQLRLTQTKRFKSGNVLLTYVPGATSRPGA